MASSSSASGGSSSHLRQWLPLCLRRTDATITHLNTILSTSAGTDATLSTVNYVLVVIVSQLDRISRRRLENAALAVAQQIDGKLLPGEAIMATISHDPMSRLALISKKLRTVSDRISDVRIFLRLWGLIGMWQWGSDLLKDPPKDRLLKAIAWSQVGANIAYQYLENGAYLAQHGILNFDERKLTKWWVWSSRFWMVHVALDFVRLWRERNTRVDVEENGEKEGGNEILKKQEKWWHEAYVNAAYAPLTLHWSMETGVVSEAWVGILGTIAGVLGFREKWRSTT